MESWRGASYECLRETDYYCFVNASDLHICESAAYLLDFSGKSPLSHLQQTMKEDESLDSFRSSLDANHEWPCLFTFKFIVPKDQIVIVLGLFADDPVSSRESSTGRFTSFTIDMHVHSADEVIAIYQRVAQVPGVLSL